jgi:hypothetical protein
MERTLMAAWRSYVLAGSVSSLIGAVLIFVHAFGDGASWFPPVAVMFLVGAAALTGRGLFLLQHPRKSRASREKNL